MMNEKQTPSIDIRKPLGMHLNKEGASLLIKGLEKLPLEDKQTVVYQKMMHDLNMIVTIWNRRIKNEKIVQEHRRVIKAAQKNAKQAPQTTKPVVSQTTKQPEDKKPQ